MLMYELKGQDRLIKINKPDLKNVMTLVIDVDPSNSVDEIFGLVIKKIEKELQNPKSVLRIRVNDKNDYQYYYSKKEVNEISKKIVRMYDKKYNHLDLCSLLVESGVPVLYLINNNQIYLAATHVFVPGATIIYLCGLLMDHHVLDFKVIPKFTYIPIITEVKTLPNILKTIHSFTNRKLKLDYNIKSYRLPREIKYYNCLLNNIKQIKYNLSKSLKTKYSYTSTVGAISGMYVFKTITKNNINIGMVYTFKNKKRFNNWSSFIVNLTRPTNCQTIYEEVLDIAKQIDNAIKKYAQSSIVLNYLITNVYNMNIFTNNYIDVLVSCIPSNNVILFNGTKANINRFDMYGTTLPLFMCFGTSNENVNAFVCSRSSDVNLNNQSSLEIDNILKFCKHVNP
jgi:hypothetical protein